MKSILLAGLVLLSFYAQNVNAGSFSNLKDLLSPQRRESKERERADKIEIAKQKAKATEALSLLQDYQADSLTCQKKSDYIQTICASVAEVAQKLARSHDISKLSEIRNGDAAFSTRINVQPEIDELKSIIKTAEIENGDRGIASGCDEDDEECDDKNKG